MEGLIQQIENDRLWISDLKELHNQVAETVAKVTAADEKIKTEELFKVIQQIENDRLWISDLKELHNQVAEAVAKVTAADEKIKTEELFKALQ